MTRARDLAAGTFEQATGGVLKLETSDTTVTDGSVLGKIEFKAPDEASGTDAILVGAAIEAVAEGTFAADNNATELVFKTGASAAADAKMTLTSGGNVGIGTSSPDTRLHVYQSADNNGLTVGGFRSTNQIKLHLSGSANEGFAIQGDRNSGSFETIYNASDNVHQFHIQGSETMRIDSSGHAIIPAGVTLGTSAGTYVAANTLDDYEEGTWTPTDNSGNSLSFTVYYARYVKIGRNLTIHGYMDFPSTSSSSNASIGGLPFLTEANGYGALIINNGIDTLIAQVASNGSFFHIKNATNVHKTNAQIRSQWILFSGSYTVQ